MTQSTMMRLVLEQLEAIAAHEGAALYFVGGCVRDLLLGRPLHDLDLVVADKAIALARVVARSFHAAFVLLDEENGIARVVLRGKEGKPGLTLDFAHMRGGALRADLGLRDLTINAMAMSPADFAAAVENEDDEPTVLDPWGGVQDLQERRLRSLGAESFLDDPLRTLRLVRLAAELDFAIEEQTAALARAAAPLLHQVSWERIRDELARTLACPHSAPYLPLLDALSLWPHILPELAVGADDHTLDLRWEQVCCVEWIAGRLHGDEPPDRKAPFWRPAALTAHPHLSLTLSHTDHLRRYLARPLSGDRRRAVLLKLAALLTPRGPTTAEPEGRRGTGQTARRLRLSNREAFYLERATVLLRGDGEILTEIGDRRAIYRLYRDAQGIATGILLLSLAQFLATAGSSLDPTAWRQRVEHLNWILTRRYEEPQVIDPPRLIDGHDLMEELALEPGPRVGRLLESVREAQAAGEVRTREEALRWAQQKTL